MLVARGPTQYPSNISRFLDLSKASYALVSSRKITYRTSSLLARIPDAPPNLFLLSFFTASSILSSIGTESSTSAGVTVTGMFSPGNGT